MSFILDALRKVDQENRQSGEIVPPVVAVEKRRKEKRNRRRQLAAMAVIAAGSAAATALLLRQPPAPVPEAALPSGPGLQAVAAEPAMEASVDGPVVETGLPATDIVLVESAPGPAPAPEPEAPPGSEAPAPVVEAAEPPPPPERPRLVLQGTSVLDGKPVAVVSDRRVFEGDIIEGAVVIRILERSVELEFEGQRFSLTL
jgi:hypothetical protein